MQVNIKVDASYAFDMLSILAVKVDKSDLDINSLENYREFKEELEKELGVIMVDNILKSQYYMKLYDLNSQIFDMVDWVKVNCKKDDPAFVTDSFNYQRFAAKQELQREFFGVETKEKKYGYGK